MERIVIAISNRKISPRFGHAESYDIYQIEQRKYQLIESIKNTGVERKEIIQNKNIQAIITGKIGDKSYHRCQSLGVKVFTVDTQDVEPVIKKYIEHTLISTENIQENEGHCHDSENRCGGKHHQHKDGEQCCGGKHHQHKAGEQCCGGKHHQHKDGEQCCAGKHHQ